MQARLIALAVALAACSGEPVAHAPDAPPADAPVAPPPLPVGAPRVFFVEPAEGAQVASPVKVVFGLEGMTVQPAGTLAEGTGHHHLIVDGAPIPAGAQVPKDAQHIHFGGGQTETTLELAPGPHSLTMQFADGNHVSYGPGMATTLNVTVK